MRVQAKDLRAGDEFIFNEELYRVTVNDPGEKEGERRVMTYVVERPRTAPINFWLADDKDVVLERRGRRFEDAAAPTVWAGNYIPAHEDTLELAESIGSRLDAFREYVTSVRDEKQADEAVKELLQAFLRHAEES